MTLQGNRPDRDRPRAIRVLVVIRPQWMAEAVTAVLRADPSFEVLEVLHDPLRAAAHAHRRRPDVVLLDCIGQGASTAAITAMRQADLPGLKLVALLACADNAAVARCFRAGAAACVTDRWSMAELTDAIKRVHAGEILFRHAGLLSFLAEPQGGGTGEPLTPRERAVLQAMVDGLTVADVAAQLAISAATVQTHLKNVMPKLGARTRLEAVVIGLKTGVIELRSSPAVDIRHTAK